MYNSFLPLYLLAALISQLREKSEAFAVLEAEATAAKSMQEQKLKETSDTLSLTKEQELAAVMQLQVRYIYTV